MKTASAKAKGRALCKWLKSEILGRAPKLSADDIRVTSSGSGGEDITLSPLARRLFPFQFECKNLAAFAGYKYHDQASEHGDYVPVVVVRANRREPLAIINAHQFLDILQQLQQKEADGN